MKHYFLLFILLSATIAMCGCTEELQPETSGTNGVVLDESGLTEAELNLSVNTFAVEVQAGTRASIPSSTPETETAEEKEILNIWVFQYDAVTEELLIKPRYYTITDQTMLQNLPVYLKAGVPSLVYVVTNTGYDNWANDGTDASWQRFKNLEQLKKQTLPTAFPLRSIDKVSIPMAGASEEVEVTAGITVTVPVTRMYAKLKVKVVMLKLGMELNNVNVRQIPNICQVETFAGNGAGEPMNAIPFPDGTTFSSIAFAASDLEKNEDKEWAVFYVPENLQGEIETLGGSKSDVAPSDALVVDVTTEIDGERYLYAAYPGGNSLNNFNIQRNQVYRMTLTITGEKGQNNPSSNCFVVKPNGFLSFEPYYRVETGGGYNFADYLSPHDENLKIARVGIIWQTKDCIGNNTDGTLVQLGENTGDIHQKIYVRTQKKGNALIGAYNSKGDILWSWHIWVTDHEPDNLGKAVTYYTYDWDNNGIYPEKPRIQGYAVMSCNLGALADNQKGIGNGLHRYPDEITQAFGMLYQWGRKDPFPPLRNVANEHQDYNDEHTDQHYDNSNQIEVHKTSVADESKLFHSVIGSTLTGAVRHAIANPTVFICGTKEVNKSESYVQLKSNYFNNGDWCPIGESDNKLWGGLEPASDGMKAYTINPNNNVHIYDNYGTEKIHF
ncbi:DUF4906 domain-containing protein [Bacteroides thetaiotaomicron]|nr:DUF4906 domain-containing protein [Bacteroides thetaiotaomicron]